MVPPEVRDKSSWTAQELPTKARRYEVAVGDVHGCLAELIALMDRVAAATVDGEVATLVFLGDYPDRGPKSREAVAFVREMERQGAVCLKGNHEALMADAVLRNDTDVWLGNGGVQTLASYASGVEALKADARWMDALPFKHETSHRYFVHAGFMPGFAYEEQDEEVCTWIRDRFHRAMPGQWPKHIAHGHTPVFPRINYGWRTNVDTGCFHTGVLTAAIFDADKPGGPMMVVTNQTPLMAPLEGVHEPSSNGEQG